VNAAHPSIEISKKTISDGMSVIDAFVFSGLCSSKGEARRLIRQGGAYIGPKRIEDESVILVEDDFIEGALELWAGKKRHKTITLK